MKPSRKTRKNMNDSILDKMNYVRHATLSSPTEYCYKIWTECLDNYLTLKNKYWQEDQGRRHEVPLNRWWVFHFFPVRYSPHLVSTQPQTWKWASCSQLQKKPVSSGIRRYITMSRDMFLNLSTTGTGLPRRYWVRFQTTTVKYI